jgi:UDP-N-acetylmuramyl pentapeptide phosphotransferase/UDP-N-acetylglucosamine-1-phosphate transferase
MTRKIISMIYTLSVFFLSFVLTLMVVKYKNLHIQFTTDHESGPQKLHSGSVARIGGLGIFVSLVFVVLARLVIESNPDYGFIIFFLCTAPCFLIGLTEDITKKIGVKLRLMFTAISAAIGIYLLDGLIYSVDLPIIDDLLKLQWFGYLFTVFAITGISNAYNIVDGLNGLAGMSGVFSLMGIYYVAYLFGDSYIMFIAQILIASILGFLVLNYPKGKIFLGDAGAYLIGFCSGFLSLLLVDRHTEISPWFALLLNFYPVFETLYSIFRRKFQSKKDSTAPDAEHFHSLVYFWFKHEAKNKASLEKVEPHWVNNAKASITLWVLPILCAIPASLFFYNSTILKLFVVLFCVTYILIYRVLIRRHAELATTDFSGVAAN